MRVIMPGNAVGRTVRDAFDCASAGRCAQCHPGFVAANGENAAGGTDLRVHTVTGTFGFFAASAALQTIPSVDGR